MPVTIQKEGLTITCDDPAQAAAFVQQLLGALTRSVPSPAATPAPRAKRSSKARAGDESEKPTSSSSARGAVKEAVFAAIAANPEPDFDALAKKVYGRAGSTERNRLKACIAFQVRQGALKELASGGWKVV
jgi:hypothetical protein